MREDWVECCFEDLLDYEQPTKYIVNSTNYSDDFNIPVLTAGKSFIKGYTNEENGIFQNLPTIIFDDFTTASQFVNFKFKVKSSAMKILIPTSELINMKFTFYGIKVNNIRTDTHKRYWISIYAKKSFKLPPLPEQRAIVVKIETLFSDLDNGINDLKKAQEKLKIYRQAVLKKAFEGELTKEWREKQTNLPTAEELLDQIKVEREIWIANEIKQGNNEAKRIKNKLAKNSILKSINKIPKGWRWVNFLNACLFVIDCHNKTAPYVEFGIYLIRTTNIKNGKLDLSKKIRFVSEETYKYWSKRAYPKPGDIIFTREAPMGEAAIIPQNEKICLGQRTMLLRTSNNFLNNKYLLYNILSEDFQQRFKEDAIGTGVKHLRVGDVEELVFPLCSIEEQHQIVKEIETRLSVCDKLEESIKEGLEKAEALRQSILKKAFEGNLLTEAELKKCKEAEDYEPASVLLEKIKKEKLKNI